jgi:hypothetical protein
MDTEEHFRDAFKEKSLQLSGTTEENCRLFSQNSDTMRTNLESSSRRILIRPRIVSRIC